MITLLRKSAQLLKHFRQDKESSPFIDIQSKLLPILASIIMLCSENINENDTNICFNELIYSVELLTSKWIDAIDSVPNYFHSYKEEGECIITK